MDLKDFKSTSTLAIEAVYNYFWNLIPSKYRIQTTDHNLNDLAPFYDVDLTFENRLHYKLTKVAYPNRTTPWFIITWNTEQGILKSTLSQRRFISTVVDTPKGKIRFKYINADLRINLGICCNTMQGLYELQENIVLKTREKITINTKEHFILGSFPVCLNTIEYHQSKLERDKGTLCYLFLECTIDYPIIENLEDLSGKGIILQINNEIKNNDNTLVKDTIIPET